MRPLFWVVSAIFVLLTVFPLIRTSIWWVRAADFPRLQIASALAALLAAYVGFLGVTDFRDILYLIVVAPALGLQVFRIFPYTIVAPNQVMEASSLFPENRIRIIISNVLMENRRSADLLETVRSVNPDILLVVETDSWWHEKLAPLDAQFPYRIKRPQDNYYGMELFWDCQGNVI